MIGKTGDNTRSWTTYNDLRWSFDAGQSEEEKLNGIMGAGYEEGG